MRGLKVGAAIIASQFMHVIKTGRAMKLPALFIERKKRRANNRKQVDMEPSLSVLPRVPEQCLKPTDKRPNWNRSEELDLHSLCEQCDTLAKSAIKLGGLSHDWFVDLYSSNIDRALENLPEARRNRTTELANEIFDYRSPSEREQTIQQNAQNGRCRHGIALECCPAGCGSVPDESVDPEY